MQINGYIQKGGIFICILLFLVTACTNQMAEEEPTPTPIPTSVVPLKPTYTVQRGDVIDQMKFTGRVSPVLEQELFFPTSGRVRNVYVKQGGKVTSGQVLADLEGIEDLERNLESTQLNVRRNELYLENAQNALELFKVTTPKWVRGYEYELAMKENDVELANIALEEAKLSLKDLEEIVSDSQIVAPFDGEVLTFRLTDGKGVEAYQPVAVIGDVSQLEVSAELRDEEMRRLAVGMPVSLALYSKPGEVLTGKIRKLPYPFGGGGTNVEDEDKATRISVDASAKEAGFELGDLISIAVVLQNKEDVLWIPPQAIRVFEGRRFVVIQDGDLQRRVDVRLGVEGEGRVEILEGLEEGQIIVGP